MLYNNKKYDLAISIRGPNISDSHTEFLTKHAENVVEIGDGKRDILDGAIQGELLDVLTNLRKDYGDLAGKSVLVYVNAHGLAYQGSHYLQTSFAKNLIQTGHLFLLLRKNIDCPMDLIFSSCFGKAGLQYTDILPKNSNLMFFADEDNYSYSLCANDTETAILNQPFESLEFYYDNYLANLKYRENPIYLTVGKEVIDPYKLSKKYYGKPLNQEQKQYVHNHFGNNICLENSSCHDKLDKIMDEIEKFSSIEEQFQIRDNYYLKDFDDLDAKLAYAIHNNDSAEIVAGYQQEIEQLLSDHYHLPLKVDLSHPRWQNEDEDEDGGLDYIKIFSQLPEKHFIEVLLECGFKAEEDFVMPDDIDYGLALGVVKDLENYSHALENEHYYYNMLSDIIGEVKNTWEGIWDAIY